MLRQLRIENILAARRDLLEFALEVMPDYKPHWHHRLICKYLEKILEVDSLRLQIWIPPQYGKSLLTSRMLPAFLLGIDPAMKIILASYSGELADGFNRDCQKIIQSDAYKAIFPRTRIQGDKHRKLKLTANHMETSAGGYLFTVGVGGGTTGRTANCFICDDLIKDMRQAESKTQRNFVWDWFNAVAQTRCSKNAPIIVMNTRWHDQDISGMILTREREDKEASKYDILCLPASFDENHPYRHPEDPRTEKGEPLWPEVKGDIEKLNTIKHDVGSRVWASLFQQSPVVDGGNIIKREWIKTYHDLPLKPKDMPGHNLVQSWDLQFKSTGQSFTVGVTIFKYGSDFYLLDIYRKRADIIETRRAIKEMAVRWPKCSTILIEDKANGPAILTLMAKELSGLIPVSATATKDERLHVVAPIFEAGNFHVPANHPETFHIIDELTNFPVSQNDDIVDAISQALTRFTELKGLRALEGGTRW